MLLYLSLLLFFALLYSKFCFLCQFTGNAGQQRPDVVPGADTEDSTSGGLTSSNNPGSSKIGSRPKHKRQDQVQQLSYNHSRYLKRINLL